MPFILIFSMYLLIYIMTFFKSPNFLVFFNIFMHLVKNLSFYFTGCEFMFDEILWAYV